MISHVSHTVSVACFGRVDACGVCGGNNGTCGGCDGVPLSGKAVDACGVCGGTGSTCCIPKPAQAQWHYVRVDNNNDDDWSSMVTRARVGDLVVWENLLDRDVEVVGGLQHWLTNNQQLEISIYLPHSVHRTLDPQVRGVCGAGGVVQSQNIKGKLFLFLLQFISPCVVCMNQRRMGLVRIYHRSEDVRLIRPTPLGRS